MSDAQTWFPPLQKTRNPCDSHGVDQLCEFCEPGTQVSLSPWALSIMTSDSDNEDSVKEFPEGSSLEDYSWNPYTHRYDKRKKPELIKSWEPKKCECGVASLGYTHGHSDWCPLAEKSK